jgi:hypothetical protein
LTSRARIRLATALVVAVLLWPPVQHVLSRSLQLDPWSFFGFAMYAVPNFEVSVRAAALDGPGSEPDWNAVSVSSYSLLRSFGERRARWGLLLRPDVLAEQLLERQPELPGVLVRVRRWRISPETSRLEAVDTDYAYPRTQAERLRE